MSFSAPRFAVAAFSAALLTLTGCGLGTLPTEQITPGVALHGNVHGGQQPVAGAKVYLYSVATIGYGFNSTSILNGNGYVLTDANGNFNITADYTCPAGAYVYMVAKGGNPGVYAGANNASLAEMTALGPCANLSAATVIAVNEVTTVATAYALSGFMISDTQASTASTNLTGMHNAFSSYGQMVNSAGYALTAPATTTGIVPQAEINTLADILAACVNTDGTTGTCANIFQLTGNSTDTANAVLYIAQHPATNVASLYSFVAATPPYQPTLSAAPTDWSIAITIDGGAFTGAFVLAIDASGNAWVGNQTGGGGLVQVGPDGTFISGAAGYNSANFSGPYYVTIDPTGNIWANGFNAAATYRNTLVKYSSAGTLLSPVGGYTNACLGSTNSDAINADLQGNIWISRPRAFCSIDTNGNLLSPTTGWPGTITSSNTQARGIAVDASGNTWLAGSVSSSSQGNISTTGTLAKFSSAGAAISPTAGYTSANYQSGYRMAIDSANDAWVPNYQVTDSTGALAGNGSLFSFNSSGTVTSPAAGYAAPTAYSSNNTNSAAEASFVDGTNRIWTSFDVASSTAASQLIVLTAAGASAGGPITLPQFSYGGGFDASGNLWLAGNTTILKVIGIGSPTITPLSQAALQNKIGQRP